MGAVLLPMLAAADQRPPPPDALQVDQDIQALKEQSLEVVKEARTVEQNFLYPTGSRVSVNVGVRIPGMLIRDIKVSIDGTTPVYYEYSEIEGIVLQERGLHKVLTLNAAPGMHHIHAQFSAQYADAKPTDRPFVGHYDGNFSKGRQPAELELEVSREDMLAEPSLRFVSWEAAP